VRTGARTRARDGARVGTGAGAYGAYGAGAWAGDGAYDTGAYFSAVVIKVSKWQI